MDLDNEVIPTDWGVGLTIVLDERWPDSKVQTCYVLLSNGWGYERILMELPDYDRWAWNVFAPDEKGVTWFFDEADSEADAIALIISQGGR